MITISILTLFPEMFEGFLDNSIVKRAVSKGAVRFRIINIRDFSLDRNHRVDDRPTGGGAGLVMRMEPLMDCIRKSGLESTYKILMTPKGHRYSQRDAQRLASMDRDITIVCGHYEGIDHRFESRVDELVSIGDFVLTGGEIPAAAVADSITRLIPGAIAEDSPKEESFSQDLLEYPQYTFPRDYEGDEIPEILFSGDHEKVRKYRLKEAIRLTAERRPDLLENRVWTDEELELLEEIREEDKNKPNKD